MTAPARIIENGHAYRREDDGDFYIMDGDQHSYLICAVCDDYVCIHDGRAEIEGECESRDEVLPGFEYELITVPKELERHF